MRDKYIINKHREQLFVLMETILCALSLPDTGKTTQSTAVNKKTQ